MYQQATNLIIKNVEPTSKVTIYTVSGQVLAEKNQENNNTTLQFSGLKAGLYFIKIQYDNNISTQKIIFN
jgi:hypothetical protein